MKNNYLTKSLSKVSVSTLLAAAQSSKNGNGASTIRYEVIGEKFTVRTVDMMIDAGFALPRTF